MADQTPNRDIVVISGATDGIGLVAATELATSERHLVLLGRSQTKGDKALARIRAASPNASAELFLADLSLLSETARVGAEIAEKFPRIDVLLNNAGALFASRRLTSEGFERTFALNHLGYFSLTYHLLNSLLASPAGRIVNVASRAHIGPQVAFDDINLESGFKTRRAYQMSKLANILFTRELARRLRETPVTVNCLHPGFVSTNFGMNNGFIVRTVVKAMMRMSAISVEDGARTPVFLAGSPDVVGVTGEYFVDCRRREPSEEARDDEAATRLWELSEEMTGLRYPENISLPT